jgi:hypothetical protein
VRYTVSDNGIGMAPHMIAHVFDMFAQAERSSDRSQGGLGIGLALVKNLVALHGGRVAAFSEGIGKGSRFSITLPRAAEPGRDAAPAQPGMAPAQSHGLRLLVVDDNDDAGHMLGLYLEAAGYQVTVVQSARAALDVARARSARRLPARYRLAGHGWQRAGAAIAADAADGVGDPGRDHRLRAGCRPGQDRRGGLRPPLRQAGGHGGVDGRAQRSLTGAPPCWVA